MLDEILEKFDHALKSDEKVMIVDLIMTMQNIVQWLHNSDNTTYAVDTTSGEVLMILDTNGHITYQVMNLPPMCVMFANM